MNFVICNVYLEDYVDVVAQRVHVEEGQFQRNSVGVEVGAGLRAVETETARGGV